MKLLAYHTEDSLQELLKLCKKAITNNKSVAIRVADILEAEELNNALWKIHNFVPHGVQDADFDELQPVIITWNNLNRDIFINFGSAHVKHNELGFSPESFILWNCKEYNANFKSHRQDPVSKKWY